MLVSFQSLASFSQCSREKILRVSNFNFKFDREKVQFKSSNDLNQNVSFLATRKITFQNRGSIGTDNKEPIIILKGSLRIRKYLSLMYGQLTEYDSRFCKNKKRKHHACLERKSSISHANRISNSVLKTSVLCEPKCQFRATTTVLNWLGNNKDDYYKYFM